MYKISINLPDEVHASVKKYSEEDSTTLTQVIIRALRIYSVVREIENNLYSIDPVTNEKTKYTFI